MQTTRGLWSSRKGFYRELIFKLNGKAAEDYRLFDNWENFKEHLTKGERIQPSISSLVSELNCYKQNMNQNVTEFSDKIKRHLTLMEKAVAYSYRERVAQDCFKKEHEKQATKIFREGLKEPLQNFGSFNR